MINTRLDYDVLAQVTSKFSVSRFFSNAFCAVDAAEQQHLWLVLLARGSSELCCTRGAFLRVKIKELGLALNAPFFVMFLLHSALHANARVSITM